MKGYHVSLMPEERHQVSLVVGLQALVVLRRDPSDVGAIVAYLIAHAAGAEAAASAENERLEAAQRRIREAGRQ